MDDAELNEKVRQLRRHRRELEALQQAAAALEAEIKEEMTCRNLEQITTQDYKITWKSISSTRLDAKALKEERPEIYARYAITSETRRFTVT